MTADQFFDLRPGHVVIERRSKTPRVVVAVHFWPGYRRTGNPRGVISLEKLRGSWTPCTTTLLTLSDARLRLDATDHRMRLPRRKARVWCPDAWHRKQGIHEAWGTFRDERARC